MQKQPSFDDVLFGFVSHDTWPFDIYLMAFESVSGPRVIAQPQVKAHGKWMRPVVMVGTMEHARQYYEALL